MTSSEPSAVPRPPPEGRAAAAPALGLEESIALGHAMVARAAADEGIRTLAIKGPVSEHHGLRDPRRSVDVDVWVDPSCTDRLRALLERWGWEVRVTNTTVGVTPMHSVAYRHPLWPVEIDVHHCFPGFLGDDQEVFDLVWQERSEIQQAHQPVPCTGFVASCAVDGLHLLRDPARRSSETEAFARRLADLLDATEADALADLAARTGAQQTLAPLLEPLGVGTAVEPALSDDLRAWQLRTRAAGVPSVAWVYAFSRTPVRRWPAMAKHALLLTEPEIRFRYPSMPPGRWGVLRGRLLRLGTGTRALPRAVHLVWCARSRRR